MADRTDVVYLIWRQALVAGGALNVSDEIHQFTLKVGRNAEGERENTIGFPIPVCFFHALGKELQLYIDRVKARSIVPLCSS
jgi:hypothetical protein